MTCLLAKGNYFNTKKKKTNIDECAASSSALTKLLKPDRCLPKIAAFWWEFSASAARPNRMSNFSKLCPLPIWLPFFLPTSCWQKYLYSKGFSAVLMSGVLCFCRSYNARTSQNQKPRNSMGNPDKILLLRKGCKKTPCQSVKSKVC